MSEPFIFASASELVEISGLKAKNLDELLSILKEVDEASIFHHAYQTLQKYHQMIERYPNDFAEWVFRGCGEEILAERLAGVDLREHKSLKSLRECFVQIIESYLAAKPSSRTKPARYPFYLCSSISIVARTGDVANTIEEFREIIKKCSIRTIHHHFITARLRQELDTNDFSHWLSTSAKRLDLAKKLDRIDLVMRTLNEVRDEILEALR